MGEYSGHGVVDSALRALSTLRGLRGAPEVPPLCRETQSRGQQMLELSIGFHKNFPGKSNQFVRKYCLEKEILSRRKKKHSGKSQYLFI